MMTFPTEWKKNMFQTSNHIYIYMCIYIYTYVYMQHGQNTYKSKPVFAMIIPSSFWISVGFPGHFHGLYGTGLDRSTGSTGHFGLHRVEWTTARTSPRASEPLGPLGPHRPDLGLAIKDGKLESPLYIYNRIFLE
jgi:hypothetical protein